MLPQSSKDEIALKATPVPKSDDNHKSTTTPSENLSEPMKEFVDQAQEKESVEEKIEFTSKIKKTSSVGKEKSDKTYSENQKISREKDAEEDQNLNESSSKERPDPIDPENIVISDKEFTATLSIRCDTILDNISWLDEEKVELVPEDGVIFAQKEVIFYEGESVFNVLLREMKKNKIHLEFVNTPIYNSAYIEGIANLYEFDCGELSGWAYKVNDWFPNYGSSRYGLQEGDKIEWLYTCDLGADIGGYNSLAGE